MRFFNLNALLAFVLCFIAATTALAGSDAQDNNERLFKAAFVYNFAKFSRWPDDINTPKNNVFHLCTIGKSLLINDLKHLEGKTIQGRLVNIISIKNASSANHCQVLYIASSEKNRYSNILAITQNQPILTVSEISFFARNGGIIQFYRKKGKTRLVINLNAAHQAGLEISSRLLILAEIIGQKKP